jgi:hypothetical protein
MKLERVWAMPPANGDTFDCLPIGELVRRYLANSKTSVDPFARNKRWATFTNDLNPSTQAEYHLDVLDFLRLMIGKEVGADLVIWDPPYSPRQAKELYDSIGLEFTQRDGQRTHAWSREKELVDRILVPGGVFLYFGWDSIGMGMGNKYSLIDGLLVCHGGSGHNDTICTVWVKTPEYQLLLIDWN